jgi:hypothetical protein
MSSRPRQTRTRPQQQTQLPGELVDSRRATKRMGQAGLGVEMEESAPPVSTRRPWPSTLPERIRAIRAVLAEELQPLDVCALARAFTRAGRQDVQDIAEALVSLHQARRVDDRYTV